ncbi:hypothetical protein SAMN05192534_11265 [Alteribacillus persepolensis]|uniref:Uncharacterized protein n=1 Tax=Alteribacillus persepolensis TaxID=568899 RepID=A0A1G8FJQ9_9BACI|nr:hypothetical protein [Alteribacillus persepolensis]SDH82341.1 hypothetical protein SAMN05192534_11265 [Alteribacillus persepolensis]
MAGYLKRVMEKTKMTLQQATMLFKEKVYDITGTTTATIDQLSAYIQRHPDVQISKRTLLGMTFTFYHLQVEGIHFYVEMRDGYLLQMDVYTSEHDIVSYRSYRDQHVKNIPIKFP